MVGGREQRIPPPRLVAGTGGPGGGGADPTAGAQPAPPRGPWRGPIHRWLFIHSFSTRPKGSSGDGPCTLGHIRKSVGSCSCPEGPSGMGMGQTDPSTNCCPWEPPVQEQRDAQNTQFLGGGEAGKASQKETLTLSPLSSRNEQGKHFG